MVNKKLRIVELSVEDIAVLQKFLDNLGDSRTSFRYFEKRPLSVIANHLITILLMEYEEYVGYGHLEEEHGNIWLGIAVADGWEGKGYGTKMMEYLMNKAHEKKIKHVFLSVDKDNKAAISLYKKIGFNVDADFKDYALIMKKEMN